MNSNTQRGVTLQSSDDQQDRTAGPVKHPALLVWSLIVIGLIALGAHVSKYLGADLLATVLAILAILGLSALCFIHLTKRALHAAALSSGRTGAYSPGVTAVWKTLWVLPVALFTFGFFADLLLGFKEEGKAMGVVAVVLLLSIIPTYLVLWIMRLVQRDKTSVG